MRLLQYCSARLGPPPRCLADFEAHAKSVLMKDVYKFYASGSKVGSWQTLRENVVAYSRFVWCVPVLMHNISALYTSYLATIWNS